MDASIAGLAIEAVKRSRNAFCKFISANDAGETGAHQAGFYMPKDTVPLMFDTPGIKGANKDRYVKIKWQNDFETESRFIYYGTGTRNEYRLTRFGKGFPFLRDDNVGDLMILCQIDDDYYEGYVLNTEADFEAFFSEFNMTSQQTNRLIIKDNFVSAEEIMKQKFAEFIAGCTTEFPITTEMAAAARSIFNTANKITEAKVVKDSDKVLLNWIETEYNLFKSFENSRYAERISTPFPNVEDLVCFANTVLNRRKSRAGKSLEHHLCEIFTLGQLQFETQAITEMNKKPDFLFPGSEAYHDILFSADKLICLGAKTTCKDRWRQVLTEAERVETKHLFTLQQGISKNQLDEMYASKIQLIVPAPYLSAYDKSYHDRIMTLGTFVSYVKEMQK